MVNQQKSKCQLRLEARSLAYQQKQRQQQQHPTSATSPSSSSSDSADTMEPYVARIERATETRTMVQRQRRAHARARVLHAQRVAAETWAKRRDAVSKSRAAAREKLEIASARREVTLQRLQEGCKRRVEAVLEKVESMKEIQRYREERQRRALDDQLVDAARRREEQTQKMVRRLSERWQCVESVKDRVQRAKFIQRWYRRHVEARKAALKLQTVKSHIATLVESWQRVASSGFEDSMVVMQQRELARAAQYVLRVLLPSATGDQSPTNGPAGASPRSKGAPFRVLLMVGMLAAHPAEIMEKNKCNRLVFASKAVLRAMEGILVCLKESDAEAPSPNSARALKVSVAQLEARFAFYFDCFSQWKDRDAERLAQEMLRSYQEIYRTKLHYSSKATDHANDGMHQLVQQTERQLMQLRSAVAQVIGKDEALQRIAALEESSRAHYESNSGSSSSGSSEDDMEVEHEVEPSPEKRKSTKARRAAAREAAAPIQPPPAPVEAAKPPAQVESLLGDEKLVHELILNPSFRLPGAADGNSSESLAGRVRSNMIKAFWDQAVAANDVNTLLQHLEELRGLFASVVKSRTDLGSDVANALHPMAMRELLANPADHFPEIRGRCVRVLQAIRDAEAPARNEVTEAFLATFNGWFTALVEQQTDAPSPIRILVDFLAFALDKVEQIRVDMINAHLGMLATYLGRHGTDYEQKKFHDKLAAGAEFSMTEKWLALELQALLPRLPGDVKTGLEAHNAAAFSEVLRRSMMALVWKHIDGSTGVWPETFALDIDRIRGFRDSLDRMTLISSMLAVVQDYLARRRLPVSRDFFAQLGKDLSALLGSPGVSGGNLVTRAMDDLLRFQASNGVNIADDPEFQALEQRLQGSFQSENPIFGLFSSRVTSAVQSIALHDRGEWNMHPSLLAFEGELRGLASEMQKLFKLNEVVHATLYNATIKKVLASSTQ